MFESDKKPIPATSTVKLLGITIDCRLKFSEHVNTLCKKANNKTSAISRVAEYLDQDKRRILYNTFIMSNFNYCPLIWMFSAKMPMYQSTKGTENNVAGYRSPLC